MAESRVDGRVHAAAVGRDGGYAAGFVAFDEARRPVALGGWRVSASDHDGAVAKAAIAGLYRAPIGGRIALHARPANRWRATGHIGRFEEVAGATVVPNDPRPSERDLARGIADAGFQTRLLYDESLTREPASPVRVYADGSERRADGTTTASYGVVDDRGRVLAAGTTQLAPDAGYLAGEFRGVAAGVRAAAALDVGRVHVVTDNRRVVAVLSGEEASVSATDATRDARRAVAAAVSAPGLDVAEIHETNRRYNQFADALAEYGHHYELSLAAETAGAVNWF